MFTNVQLSALTTDVQEFIEKNSMRTLCTKTGLGETAIRNLLEQKADELSENHLYRISQLVSKQPLDTLYKTEDAAAFLKAKDTAIRHRLMVGITGNTGTGKSYMSKAVARERKVLYYNCHLKKSARHFLQDLLLNMGAMTAGNLTELLTETSNQILWREISLIIVDEADKLYPEVRSAIHALRDATLDYCGWLLVGMPAFKNNLIRGRDAGKQGYSEFYRRVNQWHHLGGLRPEEIKKILADNGIAEPEQQREFRRLTSFGELINEINLYKLLND